MLGDIPSDLEEGDESFKVEPAATGAFGGGSTATSAVGVSRNAVAGFPGGAREERDLVTRASGVRVAFIGTISEVRRR
jgi:hypothetical protein